MNFIEQLQLQYGKLPPTLKKSIELGLKKLPIEKTIKKFPLARKKIDQEFDKIFASLKHPKQSLKHVEEHLSLPKKARSKEELFSVMQKIAEHENQSWQKGQVSGSVYHGGAEHIDFLNSIYGLYSQYNPLHVDIWPSMSKYESEIISMLAHMLQAPQSVRASQTICGNISSGGTESILLAMKAYRDYARDKKGIKHPEMILPVTAHAAFDKACQYFKIKKILIPVDNKYRASVTAAKKAITKNTIVIVGSAPSFPHGVIDPIEELSELAYRHKIGFHTDACLGGFILPFVKEKYEVPKFDFSLRGVTSLSVDTHKFGYASKGSSVILYRGLDLRSFQYYVSSDWPGGLYCSPTFAGSRPGALVAQCWAAMLSMGEDGYREAALKIVETAQKIKQELKSIKGLNILGDPLWIIAFGSDHFNIYELLDFMSQKGWSLNGLHHPSCLHLCVTLPHTQEGLAERFVADIKEGVEKIKQQGSYAPEHGAMAPIYGMASSLPVKGFVDDMLKRYMDFLNS